MWVFITPPCGVPASVSLTVPSSITPASNHCRVNFNTIRSESRFRMAYDVLHETMPGRSSKEYLKILKLAAEQGEVQVDEALRELLERNAEVAITAEAVGELLSKLDTIAPVTMVTVAPVDLGSFDQLCLDMQVRQ